jgi:hypothetical protein
MKDWKLMVGVGAAVLAIWLVGAAITKYSLAEMAYLAPVAVAAVGLTIAILLLWIKIVIQLVRDRGSDLHR